MGYVVMALRCADKEGRIMAKTRMNSRTRETLRSLADKVVCPSKEKTALMKAYEKAAPLVRKAVEKKYPQSDMAVLKKYELTFVDDTIRLQLNGERVEQFEFEENTGPLIAGDSYSCSSRMYQVDERTSKAVDSWLAAQSAFDDERTKRISAYRSLIANARYVEDVVAVWPEAAQHIPEGRELLVVPTEAIATIAEDVAERQAA